MPNPCYQAFPTHSVNQKHTVLSAPSNRAPTAHFSKATAARNSTLVPSSLLKNRAFGEWAQGQMSAVESSPWSVLSFLLSRFASQPKGLRVWTKGSGEASVRLPPRVLNSTLVLSSLLMNRAFGEWPQGQMSAVKLCAEHIQLIIHTSKPIS